MIKKIIKIQDIKISLLGTFKAPHKLPRKLLEDKKEDKSASNLARMRQHRGVPCRPSCKERGKLLKQELSSLTTLHGRSHGIDPERHRHAQKMLAGMQERRLRQEVL